MQELLGAQRTGGTRALVDVNDVDDVEDANDSHDNQNDALARINALTDLSGRLPGGRYRSHAWFDPLFPGSAVYQTLIYLERYTNRVFTLQELRSGKPIVAIVQTGSKLAPCNYVHVQLEQRIAEGIREAGGLPLPFPAPPIFENNCRPTAAEHRNEVAVILAEILSAYQFDAAVFTTGCDKTSPACAIAASMSGLPSAMFSGGPMSDGWHKGELVGSGVMAWRTNKEYEAKLIDLKEVMKRAENIAPSDGYCNPMGTAASMNALLEALGLSLTRCASIPAPAAERSHMAYDTGRRIVDVFKEDLRPEHILTRESFLNAIMVLTLIGGSSNAVVHLIAMAKHAGVELTIDDFETYGRNLPLIVNMQPAGKYLGEAFHRAGGVPAVMWELKKKGLLFENCMTVTGRTIGENVEGCESTDRDVILPFDEPLKKDAGFAILKGNLFRSAVIKTSVISESFRQRYLSTPGSENIFEAKAVVFNSPEEHKARIDTDPTIDENSILVLRYAGPVGWPGSAEVGNLRSPTKLFLRGIELPTLSDGRKSGTCAGFDALHASPEAAIKGGLWWLQEGDVIRVDLNANTCDALVEPEEIERRKRELPPPEIPESRSFFEERYREEVTQLDDGAVYERAVKYRNIAYPPRRHNH